jgi:hypothetical protein
LVYRGLAKSGISKTLLDKLPVFGIGRKAIEQTVARNAGHSFEMFDDLFKPILYLAEFLWILNIIRNIGRHQFAVLDFDDYLPAFRHADSQSRKVGCSECSHRRVHRLFRISPRHRVVGIGPPRPLVMRITRSRRCECLKHLFQKEDKLIPEWFCELIVTNRWIHALYP